MGHTCRICGLDILDDERLCDRFMVAVDYHRVCINDLIAARDAIWEEAAKIADQIGRQYAAHDLSKTDYPDAETCAAVACAVNIAAALRAAAKGET